MCQAVATCHAVNVFHRDIKPENFIVTDGWVKSSDGRQERKVVVKLTDFGLSTNDVESADMDCGSAPYMSYGMFSNNSTLPFTKLNGSTVPLIQSAGTTLRPRTLLVLRMSGHLGSFSSTCTFRPFLFTWAYVEPPLA